MSHHPARGGGTPLCPHPIIILFVCYIVKYYKIFFLLNLLMLREFNMQSVAKGLQ